ncbi:hypothetical protein ACRQ5Q_14615 [Bradyrhizobium sp. PMVTL-01]|uniref:hypothetical protein n=1 Tax=Bradyrhizobium sp. PMVTL-01 TaxID=3434999 RepID=UPI003F707596
MRNYTITELLRAIERLPATALHSDRLEKSGYATHQDHWTTWLGQYNSSDGGYYGRSDTGITDAHTVYQRLNCGPMICWLVEAAGESPILVKATILKMAREGNGRAQTEAKIAREAHPWERAATLLFR